MIAVISLLLVLTISVIVSRASGDRASKLRFGSTSESGALCQVPSGACGGEAEVHAPVHSLRPPGVASSTAV